MPSRERVKAALRRLPGWEALALARALVRGGERRQAAVAVILRPDNLFQPYGTTSFDRYPGEFAAVRDALSVSKPVFLSFGCSSGEELLSLHQHFPTARIHGLDVNPIAVRTARKRVRAAGLADTITVARAGDAVGEPAASYDVALALAVFRHADLNEGPERCDGVLRFADFERTVEGLATCLRPGGLFVIRHANFPFTECAVAGGFEAVRTDFAVGAEVGLYPVYGRDDLLLPATARDDGIYRKLL